MSQSSQFQSPVNISRMKCMVILAVVAVVAVSADVRDALRNSRQAIILAPGLPLQQAQPVLVRAEPAAYQPLQREPYWRILKQVQEFDPAGYYRYSYQTENGISAEEEGTVTRAGSQDESIAKQGGYSYTGTDGVQYSVSYVADENGFRPQGAHLPTPPPIPEAILRSLEQNAREEQQGGFKK